LKERLKENSDNGIPAESTRNVRMTELPFVIQAALVVHETFFSAPTKKVVHYSFTVKEYIIAFDCKPPCLDPIFAGIL
jgi:hypothetical protein